MNYYDKTTAQLVDTILAMQQQLAGLEAQIIEQKLAEAEHRLSDEILRQMPDAIIVTDANKIIQRWLGMASEVFGYTAAEVVGRHIRLLDHPDFLQDIILRMNQQLQDRGYFFGEVLCIHKDGTKIPIEVRAKTIYDDTGQLQGYISINRDITERKQAETALREAELKYRTLVETLPAITYILEQSETGMKPTYISPQVETILGFSQAEWLSSSDDIWKQQLHPDDREEVFAAITRNDANNENLNLEYRCLTRDGRVIWFHDRSANLEAGDARRLVHGVMFDITQQKQLEAQLRQAQRMEAVGQMAGGIAHNFNNVLTALIGHTELALDTIPPEHTIRPDLESIRKSALRAADLTQQLLAFTRRQNTKPRIININELVADFSPMFRQIIGADVELAIILEPDLAHTKADADQIEQVLINLVVNARDAMPNGGKLTIKTENVTVKDNHSQLTAGNYTLLSVTDTGVGMTKEVMAHIFEPFYTTKEGNQQAGLGLSTCFGIVKQNEGHILVESRPGKGTTFEVYLPCYVAENLTSVRRQPQHLPLPTGTETILLVDDARLVREMSARVLRQQGYIVLEAEDGKEALKVIEGHKQAGLDLLITDIVMPQMGGDVLAQQIQVRYPGTKVLFISGHSHRRTASLGETTLQSAILTKPFSPDILSIEVRKLLDRDSGDPSRGVTNKATT